jgi:hypothetical protein
MSKLYRNRRLRWSLFVAALIALGVGIYQFQPPEPVWTAKLERRAQEGNWGRWAILPAHFSPDGRHLYTATAEVFRHAHQLRGVGPTWNVADGSRRATFNSQGQSLDVGTFSKDRRYVIEAFESTDGRSSLHLVNLQSGVDRILPIQGRPYRIHFSGRSDVFAVFLEPSFSVRIYETATGQLIDERESAGPLDDEPFCGDTFVHKLISFTDGDTVLFPIECWSLQSRKPIRAWRFKRLPVYVSPEGGFLLANNFPGDGKPDDEWRLWNLRTGDGPFHVRNEIPSPFLRWFGDKELSLSAWKDDKWVHEFHDLSSMRRVADLRTPGAGNFFVRSPDGRLIVAFGEPNLHWRRQGFDSGIDVPVQFFDAESHQEIAALGCSRCLQQPLFTHDSARLIFWPHVTAAVRVFDVKSRTELPTIRLPRVAHSNLWSRSQLSLTPDSRYLLVHDRHNEDADKPKPILHKALQWFGVDAARLWPQFNDFTIVFDLESNSERFRLRGWNASHPVLSDDGNTMVTWHETEEEDHMRCWAVNGFKPLRWSIGVPTGLAMMGALFSGWRRQRKGKETPGPD